VARGDDTGVDVVARGASRRIEARRKRLAMAPAGVNRERWLANRQGRTLSADRVLREVRQAIRKLDGRPSEAGRAMLAEYEALTSLALQPTLDTIAVIQEARKERKARKRRRRRREDEVWPTYWTYPKPLRGSGIRPVDELEGDALRAYNSFSISQAKDTGVYDACFAEYDQAWRDERGGEDRAMPMILASMARGACRTASWYAYVLDQPWGELPLGVYEDDLVDDIREVLEQSEAEEEFIADLPDPPDDDDLLYDPTTGDDDIPF